MSSLLEAGAGLTPAGPGRPTALHAAAAASRKEAAAALLGAGLAVDIATDQGVTPLIAAVQQPQEAGFLHFEVDGGPADQGLAIEAVFFRVTPDERSQDVDIMAARDRRREETALFLLDRGADPARRKADGETVPFGAARRGMVGLMDRLIGDGLDTEITNEAGETALFAAVRADQPAALDELVRRGANWRLRNLEGQRPLDIALKEKQQECVGILEWRDPLHWSAGAGFHYASAALPGYEHAPGAGGFLDLHFRLMRSLWVNAECGYTVRGTYAPADDPWLVSTFGSPYYEYQHVDFSALLNVALLRGYSWRLSAVAGADYRLQTAAVIRTDSEVWEPMDVQDQLASSGWGLTFGLGLNAFSAMGGMLAGAELRYTRTLDGGWTSRGGGLESWILLVRLGS